MLYITYLFFWSRESIVRHLSIPDGLCGVISDIPLPNNLLLTVSKDENRDAALVQLLKKDNFADFQSIIVYCSRRDVCERVANYIRTCFQVHMRLFSTHLNQKLISSNLGGGATSGQRSCCRTTI